MTQSTVHVVHCVDTEGPLHESLEATFLRLRDIFGLHLPPSRAVLGKLQRQELELDGIDKVAVAKVVSPFLIEFNDTWDKIDAMLTDIRSEKYRARLPDSFGRSWIYNWFCIDYVGFVDNERRRDMGFHNIFDHYVRLIEEGDGGDGLHFHHHPISFNRQAHRSATHYFSHTPVIFEILARRVIDRHWFPSVNRPGFHTTRPDSNWLMEQFIPFDYANQATSQSCDDQPDLSSGRFGDWRRAPMTWTPYHPSHDDWQTPGACRRWIGRCLNMVSRLRELREADVVLAFEEAQRGQPVVLAFTNHESRDMRVDIEAVQDLLRRVSIRYPNIPFRYGEAREAMRLALDLPVDDAVRLDIRLEASRLSIRSDRLTFGPQPFLALKTKDGRYFHDNLDFQQPFREWSYTFDAETFPLTALAAIGVATCDAAGGVCVAVLDPESGLIDLRRW